MREVLIERCDEGFLSGLTENHIRVKTVGTPEEINTIIPVQMECIHENEMVGQRIN